MRHYLRIGFLPLVVALACVAAKAQEPSGPAGYNSPQEVFLAYKTATNEQDWIASLALGTTAYQDTKIIGQVLDHRLGYVLGNVRNPALESIFIEHGLDVKVLDQTLQTLFSPSVGVELSEKQQQETFSKVATFVLANSKDQPKLYHRLRSINSNSNDEVIELRDLTDHGDTATGFVIGKRLVEEVHSSPGKEPKRILRSITTKSQLDFRRVDGRWYLDVSDEDKKMFGLE